MIPRPEHPTPQWERAAWRNLNGEWEFDFDFGASAIERKLWEKEKFDLWEKIVYNNQCRLRLAQFFSGKQAFL